MTTPDLPDWTTRVAFQADQRLLPISNIPAGGSSAIIPVLGYNSVVVNVIPSGAANMPVFFNWISGGSLNSQTDYLSFPVDGGTVDSGTYRLPVRGQSLVIGNNGSAACSVELFGSQVIVSDIVQSVCPDQFTATTGLIAVVSGTIYDVGGLQFFASGLYQCQFVVSPSTITGEFMATGSDWLGQASNVRLALSTEGQVLGGIQTVCKQVYLPVSPSKPRFLARATGNATVTVSGIRARSGQ